MSPCRASTITTDTGKPLRSEPAQENGSSQSINRYKPYWLSWVVIFEAFLDVMTFLFWVRVP